MTISVMAQNEIFLGNNKFSIPTNWVTAKTNLDSIVLRSPSTKQQATISILQFGSDASFEDFKRLCDKRLEAEKKESSNVFIEPSEPFKSGEKFGMFYSGGDKKAGRMFSGFLSLNKRELTTIYVESIGADSVSHLKTFQEFVKGMKPR